MRKSILFVALCCGLLLMSCDQKLVQPTAPTPPANEATYTNLDDARPFVSILSVDGLVHGDAHISDLDIGCDGATDVVFELISQNSIEENPVDVMLVLDRSGSMAGSPLDNLKTAANRFVDIIDEATDGSLNGIIEGSRVGIVSFASSASLDRALTSSSASLKSAINALSAGGNTAAGDGMNLAQAQLAGSNPGSMKVMIVVSDGATNTGASAHAAAANARAAGTEIFAIGFGSISSTDLRDWATDPDATHVFFSPTSDQLTQVFEDLGADIVRPGGSNIVFETEVFSHFSISGAVVSKGTVNVVGSTITWTIDELGSETVHLAFTATHDPTQVGGAEHIYTSLTYTDDQGNTPMFPDLVVNVRGCPRDIDLTPEFATNELGTPGQTHAVQALVTDDFGDPVEGVPVGIEITAGPNVGVSNSGPTDADGTLSLMYAAVQGLLGLGTDDIQACFTDNSGLEVCDHAMKEWVDTTPPGRACGEGPNPAGHVPPADNQDGFFVLMANDAVDPDPQIFVNAGEGFVFGPFPNGTNVKYVEAPGATPTIRPGPGEVDYVIIGNRDMAIYAVDASGNVSDDVRCFVPPPPSHPSEVLD